MNPAIGTELVNPAAATRTVFRATAESTGGEYVEVEVTYPPHNSPPALHRHPAQREDFTVVSGELTVLCGDERFVAVAGQSFTVPSGTCHQMWNDGEEPAVLHWRTTPALRTGELFCALWQVARDTDWHPGGLQLLDVLSGYGEEFALC